MTPDPQIFEDAIGNLWCGRSRDRNGDAMMCDAVAEAAPPGRLFDAVEYMLAWLEPGREREERVPRTIMYSTRGLQETRAMFLTLVALLAAEGETA